MHVHREFRDPTIVRWLEEVDEQRLAEMIEDMAFDEEIAQAITHSEKIGGHEKSLSARENLDSFKPSPAIAGEGRVGVVRGRGRQGGGI